MLDIFKDEYVVEYYDCDRSGYIAIPRLIQYTQETSTRHTEALDCGMEYMQKNKMGWILIENSFIVSQLPKYGEKIIVKTWVTNMDKLYAYRCYEITNEEGDKYLQCYAKWIIYSFERNRPIRLTEELLTKHTFITDVVPVCDDFNPKVENYDSINERLVLYRDVDTNWHMNNIAYIRNVLETLPVEFIDNNIIEKMRVKYNHQIRYNDKYKVCSKKISDDEYIYNIIESQNDKLSCSIYIKWRKK